MLSRLFSGSRLVLKPTLAQTTTRVFQVDCLPNLTLKRWSGHDTMMIEPSNWAWKLMKDYAHFWFMITAIPCAVIHAIISIRANPELTEIPEGYEPRHWEYFSHPIARFMARYCLYPPEFEHELKLSLLEMESELKITELIENKVETVMKFYNDHRTKYFTPVYGDYWRIGRDNTFYGLQHHTATENLSLEDAYDPSINPVPTEGFKPDQTP